MSPRTSQDRNSDEASHESQIEDDPDPSEPFRTTPFEKKLHEHGDQGICDGGGQDAFDRTIGCAGSSDGAKDSDKSSGEEDERCKGGDELKDSQDLLEGVVCANPLVETGSGIGAVWGLKPRF